MSGGRLAFRTGAGATLQYASQWWYPFGIDYPTIKERLDILGLQVFFKNSGTVLQFSLPAIILRSMVVL